MTATLGPMDEYSEYCKACFTLNKIIMVNEEDEGWRCCNCEHVHIYEPWKNFYHDDTKFSITEFGGY